jgi:hypothetical protein
LWFAVIGGNDFCATQTPNAINPPSGGDYEIFTVWDPADDGHWNFGHAGNTFKTLTDGNLMDGVQVTNGERHAAADTAHAHFKDLEYEDRSGWHNWSSPVAWTTSDDPDFCNDFVSGNEIVVQKTC